jgi:hypothetical protein
MEAALGLLGAISRVLSKQSRPASGPTPPAIRFTDLAEHLPDAQIPYLDRRDIDEAGLTPEQLAWRRDGVLVLPGLMPDSLTGPYIERREALGKPPGWLCGTPYLQIPEMRSLALYPPLMAQLKTLIGEEMMLSLCLTGWISTERGWHQDDYLNPPFVASWYVAVWIALGDIHPDCGPFEYIPGSHRWPLLRGGKVRQFLTDEELARREPVTGINQWPKYSERFVNPAIDYEVHAFGRAPVQFLAKRGDVLIWHGRLIHRGSMPRVPGMERRSLIAHYSGTGHRPDMVARAQDENGEHYAVFDTPLVD